MKALIFDMDGTLVDSEKVHRKAFLLGLDRLGVDYDYDKVYKALVASEGIPDDVFVRKLKEEFGFDFDPLEFIALKREIYQSLVGSDVEAFSGAVDLVKSLKGKYKLALATSSSEEDLEKVLKKIGLFDTFDLKVSGAKLENPKPAPDIFLITAEKLGVNIKDCMVFEDSANGLKAAERSGAKVLAYDYKKDGSDYLKNYYTIDDYRKIDSKKLENIFKSLEEK